MGIPLRSLSRASPYLLPCVVSLSLFCLSALFLLYKVDDYASKTKTLAGHNLEPTPWHAFPAKQFDEKTRRSRAFKILQCSYLTCPAKSSSELQHRGFLYPQHIETCPSFFHSILKDLEPWAMSGISINHVNEAKKLAAFRVVIVSGKLYVDLYYDCFQTRAMFTIWGILQLLRRYPGLVPDVDMMFDCMDRPVVNRTVHAAVPLPLFRYCSNEAHFDIPFPDWSFWGWPETNIRPWNEEFKDIKQGSQTKFWSEKKPWAFWKGNPDVLSPVRVELLKCNDTNLWGAEIMRQNWRAEGKHGFESSKLSNQCNHRYKIYAEGFAWSVSLKYILSCDAMVLLITTQYQDFFSRGLIPKKNYWPVSSVDLCPGIKAAVDWGNANPSEAVAIGQAGQQLMESLSMDRIYDYMLHLMIKYSKLLDFKPTLPSSALEVCTDSLLCLADSRQRQFLKKSRASPSPYPPCKL